MVCHCRGCLRHRGEPIPGPLPRTQGSVLDRFYDWQDAMEEDSCTRECGAARNDVCVCRCRGQHHNAAHDYWKTWTRQTVTFPDGTTYTGSAPPGMALSDYLAKGKLGTSLAP